MGTLVGLVAGGGSHSVVSEIILLRQLLDAWVDLEVVKDVDAFDVTETVFQFSCQLSRGSSLITTWPFQNKSFDTEGLNLLIIKGRESEESQDQSEFYNKLFEELSCFFSFF